MAGPHAPRTRSYGIVARDALKVVVLRRGPTRHVRMLVWRLADNSIQAGQWLVGRVEPGPCAASPNGELFLYEARKGLTTFTALCRPPYFTALAFWSYGSPWTGGGFFASDKQLVLGLKLAEPRVEAPIPKSFEITDVWSYFAMEGKPAALLRDEVARAPQACHGWSPMEGGRARKTSVGKKPVTLERSRANTRELRYEIVDEAGMRRRVLGPLDWADWAQDGSLLFGKDGCLHRQPAQRLFQANDSASLVADLRDQVFERVHPSEEALSWPKQLDRRRR